MLWDPRNADSERGRTRERERERRGVGAVGLFHSHHERKRGERERRRESTKTSLDAYSKHIEEVRSYYQNTDITGTATRFAVARDLVLNKMTSTVFFHLRNRPQAFPRMGSRPSMSRIIVRMRRWKRRLGMWPSRSLLESACSWAPETPKPCSPW